MNSSKLFLQEFLEQLADREDGWRIVPMNGGWALYGGSPGERPSVWPRGEKGDDEIEAAEWLAGVAARDLGAPLTILRLTTESLLHTAGESSTASSDQVQMLLHHLHCVEEVFRNLLELAHPPELSTQVLSLNGVVQEMLEVFELRASSPQLRPAVVLDSSEPAVRADPSHLRQICFTLFSAAVTAGGTASPFEVRTHRRNGSGELSIKHRINDRSGMLPTLFSPDPRRSGGDLMRVWQVVRRHGGRFQMQVDPRRDRSFVVTLPLEEPHDLPT